MCPIYWREKTEDEQNDLITASILMNVGTGVVLTILMSVFYPMILNFLNLSGMVSEYAGEYLSVINWFLWVQLISDLWKMWAACHGDSRCGNCYSIGKVSGIPDSYLDFI